MAIQTIYRAKAFGPGAELWVVPELEASPLAQKIDWYLNFQITKAKSYRKNELPADLKALLIDNEIPMPEISVPENAPLMVGAGGRLPTEKVIKVPGSQSQAKWLSSVRKMWIQLDKPSLRVFLPPTITAAEFTKSWAEEEQASVITLVPN